MPARLLIALVCLAVSLGCGGPNYHKSGLPNAVWDGPHSGGWVDEIWALGDQASATLLCGDKHEEVASMHSLGHDWIIRVYADEVYPDSWKLGEKPYHDVLDAEWAAERYVDYYKLCPSDATAR